MSIQLTLRALQIVFMITSLSARYKLFFMIMIMSFSAFWLQLAVMSKFNIVVSFAEGLGHTY